MNSEYPPGEEFPTNLELMKEFEAHSATIQNAVNTLIRDGLIFSSGSNSNRRRVRPIPYRSSRKGDFIEEHGNPAKEVLIDIKILYEEEDLPDNIASEMDVPVLYYKTAQYRNDILVAITQSYIPNVVPLKELRTMLKQPNAMIYDCMKQLGCNAVDCQENLVATLASTSESKELHLPPHSSIPIVRIVRKAFESDGRLVQICFMIDRADCYEFEYRFPLY
jgi:GntR family transcriptional regulator